MLALYKPLIFCVKIYAEGIVKEIYRMKLSGMALMGEMV